MPATTAAPARHRANPAREALRCRVRLADGRIFSGPLASGAPPRTAARHPARADRRAGRDRRGRPARRAAADHDPPPRRPLPARRQAGGGDWLGPLLALAARHADAARRCSSPRRFGRSAGREARGQRDPLPVGRRRPARQAARAVGVPRRAPLPPARREQRRPRACLLEARRPLPATHVDRVDRRAGRADRARAPASDPSPRHRRGRQAERRRPGVRGARRECMRLAGTVNGKTGAHARILEADLELPAYPIRQLVGDLPDPARRPRRLHPSAATHEPGPVQADQPARVLRAARRDRRPARRARASAQRTRTGSRPARSGRMRARGGAATPAAAGHGARSTTSRRCCSAGRGARSCAARRSSVPART